MKLPLRALVSSPTRLAILLAPVFLFGPSLGVSQAADARSGDRKDTWRRAIGRGGRRRSDGCSSFTGLDSPMAMLDALFVTTALSAIRVDLGASIEELKSSR